MLFAGTFQPQLLAWPCFANFSDLKLQRVSFNSCKTFFGPRLGLRIFNEQKKALIKAAF